MKIFTLIACTLCSMLTTRPCVAQLSTGLTNPGTATVSSLTGASFTWNNPNGALSAGGSVASAANLLSVNTGTTDALQFTNFGFSIPTGSTINGIEVDIIHQSSGLSLTILGTTIFGSVNDNIVQLTGPGVSSTNKASAAAWPTSSSTAAYGSSSDTWGSTVWTAAMVNSPAFGVNVSSAINGGVLLGINLIPGASIDAVAIKITYSLPVTLALHLDQWSATRQARGNLLVWQATSDAMPGTFTVERSANGANWTSIAQLPAAGGTTEYSYTDESPLANGTVSYRLRLHTAGESDSWSTVQVLAAKAVHPVISLYPNPFHNTINISAPGAAFTQLTLHNAQGATIWAKAYPGGITTTQIPVAGLPQGLYFLTVDGATYPLMKGL
jgi:hypothetical protein